MVTDRFAPVPARCPLSFQLSRRPSSASCSVHPGGRLARKGYKYIYIYVHTCIDSLGMWSQPYKNVFSRVRSKGSRFTLGVGGWRVCSLDVTFTTATTVRNRSQPSATATVRNRSREGRIAVPMVSYVALLRFAWQVWHFVRFKRVS